MYLKHLIQQKDQEFLNLCRNHSIKMLYAFGSSVTDQFNEQTSDVDLLVEIDEADPIERGEKLMSLWDTLEDFFDRKVDLLTNSSLKNPILKNNIERTKVLLYDGRGQKVPV
ncbi:nucleotidyltransferase family protein [Rhodohalobacter sp. 614A]|uniref:nucleotidyltransferase family protein n=1 Tax=Rhodohalobacter sp. 614A TaxID=2908649 RepID=UPI001F422A48|nr:nucleotidyltransferase domain-containing protein [Rhodohalobacter sp. 614A]